MTRRPSLDSWLEHVRRLDLAGLLDLYEPHAVLQTLRETWQGRDEIETAFAQHGRQLRKFAIDDVKPILDDGERLSFETAVRGPFGQKRLRHEWQMGAHGITRHTMALT